MRWLLSTYTIFNSFLPKRIEEEEEEKDKESDKFGWSS